MAHPGGRPSLYDPTYCERVIELGADGLSITGMAAEIGVDKATIMEWAKVHPEFSSALSRARAISQAWWERKGKESLVLPREVNFAQAVWTRSLACMFPDDWKESTKVEMNAKIHPQEKPDLSKFTDEQLAQFIVLQSILEGESGA